MAGPAPWTLVVLVGLAAVVAAGGAVMAHAESQPGALEAEVTGITREAGASMVGYTFTVEITNPANGTIYVDHLELVTGGRHGNECPGTYGERLGPGGTAVFTGCYTLPDGDEPVGIEILGTTAPDAEHPDLLAVLPFTAEFSESCRSKMDDRDVCLPVQQIARMIREGGARPGEAPADPAGVPPRAGTATATVQPAADGVLADAVYDRDANRIVLNMTERINVFTINTNHIGIREGGCSIMLSPLEYDGHGTIASDSMALVFEPGEHTRAGLAAMEEPRIRLETGAFRLLEGAADIGAAEMILRVIGGQSVQGNASAAACVITYGYEQSPEDWFGEAGIDADSAGAVRAAVRDGFGAWAGINDHLSFEEVDEDPEVVIRWMNLEGERLGDACFDCIGGGAYLGVVLHEVDCRGVAKVIDPDTIRDIVAYQLGRSLGLEHRPDGSVDHHDPPGTFGYDIPEPAESAPTYGRSALICITYGYEQPPEGWLGEAGISAAHGMVVREAVRDGFEAWSELNPLFWFVEAGEGYEVAVRWIDFDGESLGWACRDCLGQDPVMGISLYRTDCRGDPVVHGFGMVRNTVAHELGHILGLYHYPHEGHLMWGDDEFVQDPFDARGYAVPENLPEWVEGAEEMDARIKFLDAELARLDAKHDELTARADAFVEQYSSGRDGNTIYFETRALINSYEEIRDGISDNVDEYNATVRELNALAGEWYCVHGAAGQP